jgi:hypothetical protein
MSSIGNNIDTDEAIKELKTYRNTLCISRFLGVITRVELQNSQRVCTAMIAHFEYLERRDKHFNPTHPPL